MVRNPHNHPPSKSVLLGSAALRAQAKSNQLFGEKNKEERFVYSRKRFIVTEAATIQHTPPHFNWIFIMSYCFFHDSGFNIHIFELTSLYLVGWIEMKGLKLWLMYLSAETDSFPFCE